MTDERNFEQRSPLEWKRADSLFLTFLLAATFLCYLPALQYDFVYDDRPLILNNPQILSWRFVPSFFAEHFIAPVYPHAPAVYYRPVLLVWMVLNEKIWGMDPVGWHFTAIALHLVVVAEVYFLAERLLAGRFPAALAASMVALHPIHVESVAWVMAMAEPLAASLLIGSLLAYLHIREGPSRRGVWLAGSLVLFTLAILIKENMLVLPGLILAYEWFYGSAAGASFRDAPRWQRARASLRCGAPYLVIACAYLITRQVVLKGVSHVVTPMPLGTLLATIPSVLGRYFTLLVWPVGLSVFYDVPYVENLTVTNFILPVAAVVALIGLLGWWGKRSREAAFAAVWMALPFLSVLNLTVFLKGEIVHDRYLYLPSMGFALLVGIALGRPESAVVRSWRRPRWREAVAAVLIGLMGAGTGYYRGFWKNNLTLFERAVKSAPGNIIAANNFANELLDHGRSEEAQAIYRSVLARDPNYWLAVYNLGYCFYKLGKLEEANRYLERAIALDPTDSDEFVYLGLTRFKMGRLEEAESLLRHAIALRPEGPGYHFALGMVLKARAEWSEALKEFQAELAYHPGETAALGQIKEVESHLR